MKTRLKQFFADYGFALLLLLSVIAYVSISGMFGACPACRAITNSVGMPQLGK